MSATYSYLVKILSIFTMCSSKLQYPRRVTNFLPQLYYVLTKLNFISSCSLTFPSNASFWTVGGDLVTSSTCLILTWISDSHFIAIQYVIGT